LRVACKHLRYTLNFFEDALLPDGKVLAKEISQVQDYLGTLQDHQVGIDLALEVLEKHPGNEAIINYHRERLAERDQMVQDFGDTWEKISGSGFRRRLAKIVAAL
jgi:CHAD domain-containing protein